mgnify:CR=1 FL=1
MGVPMQIQDKVAVVTGAAGGIGEAYARGLAAEGATVVIADLNDEKGKQVAEDIGGLYVNTDVSDEQSAQALAQAAVDAYGGDLVPGTSSPLLTETADYLAVAVRECLLTDPDPSAVLAYSEVVADTEVLQRALDELGDGRHPARAPLTARLAAVLR